MNQPKIRGLLGNPSKPVIENMTLYVLYSNGTLDKNASWNNIIWGQVDRIGIHNKYVVSGFQAQHGNIAWYLIKHKSNVTYIQPVWFIYQRFWAKVAGSWYQQYLTTDTISKNPMLDDANHLEWSLGWNGTLTVGANNFPFYVGIEQSKSLPRTSLKTNVTSPIDLENHAIEYQLYLNPELSGFAKKNVKWVRVHWLNDTFTDYDIKKAMNFTKSLQDMKTFSFIFLNQYKNVTINHFDFSDVYHNASKKFAEIDLVTLPNNATSYILKVGATFGGLASGQTFSIDPNIIGYDTAGASNEATSNQITGSVFTMQDFGEVDNMTVYMKTDHASLNAKCAIYRHDDLKLMGSTEQLNDLKAEQWRTFDFDPNVNLTKGTAYILVLWAQGEISPLRLAYIFYDAGATNQGHYDGETYDGWEDPLDEPNHNNNKYSIYATYRIVPDEYPPTYSNVGVNTTIINNPCLFSTKWEDPSNVDGFIFGTNNTGSWSNDTWIDLGGDAQEEWSNVTKTLSSTPYITVQWCIWANDTLNNWNDTGIQQFMTTEIVAPTYSNVGTNSTLINSPCLFYVQWNNIKLNGFIFGTNNTGTWENDTWVLWDNEPSEAWSNVTKTLNETYHIRIEWCVWANDSSNNWNDTGIQAFITTKMFNFDLTAYFLNQTGVSNANVTMTDETTTYFLTTTNSTGQIPTQSIESDKPYTLRLFKKGIRVYQSIFSIQKAHHLIITVTTRAWETGTEGIYLMPNAIPFLNIHFKEESFRFHWFNNWFDLKLLIGYNDTKKGMEELSLKDFWEKTNRTVQWEQLKNKATQEMYEFGFTIDDIPQEIADRVEYLVWKIEDANFDVEQITLRNSRRRGENLTLIMLPDNLKLCYIDLEAYNYTIFHESKLETKVYGVKGQTSWNLDPISNSTDRIIVTGFNESVPCTFQDVLDINDAQGWNMCDALGINQFIIYATLQIGDSSTETWFADENVYVMFDGSRYSDSWLEVLGNATLRFGSVENETLRLTSNGVSFKSIETEGYYFWVDPNGTAYLYSCTYSDMEDFHEGSITFEPQSKGRVWHCFWSNFGWWETSSPDWDIYDLSIYNTIWSFGFWANSTLENVTVMGIETDDTMISLEANEDWLIKGIQIIGKPATDEVMYVGNLPSGNPDYFDIRYWLLNPEVDEWSFEYAVNADNITVFRQYEFDLRISFENDTSIEGANVTIWKNTSPTSLIGSWLTWANGSIPTQALTKCWYKKAYGQTPQDDVSFNMTVTYGSYRYSKNFTLNQPIQWEIALTEAIEADGLMVFFSMGFLLALLIGIVMACAFLYKR